MAPFTATGFSGIGTAEFAGETGLNKRNEAPKRKQVKRMTKLGRFVLFTFSTPFTRVGQQSPDSCLKEQVGLVSQLSVTILANAPVGRAISKYSSIRL